MLWGKKKKPKQKSTHCIYQQKSKEFNRKFFLFPYTFCEPVLGMGEQPLEIEWEGRKKIIGLIKASGVR